MRTFCAKAVVVGVVGATVVAGCAAPPGSAVLGEARQQYTQLAEERVFIYDPEIDGHLQRAETAIGQAEYYQNLSFTLDADGVAADVEHYSQIALRELEMARLLTQTQQSELRIAQLEQRRVDVMLAANERRELALARTADERRRRQENERLDQALANAEARGAEVRRDPNQITVTFRELTFDFDKTEVREEFRRPLIDLADALKAFPNSNLIIEGYTDSRGAPAYNQKLSERRAVTVKTFLIDQGIQPQRIVDRGLGETNPVASNESEEGRARNRRVELIVATPPE